MRTPEEILKDHELPTVRRLKSSSKYSTVDAMKEYAIQCLDSVLSFEGNAIEMTEYIEALKREIDGSEED